MYKRQGAGSPDAATGLDALIRAYVAIVRTHPPLGHLAQRGLVSATASGQLAQLTVNGPAPMAVLADYQTRLNAMTAGQGRYSLALSHYEVVPPGVQQQLMGQHKVQDED